jgi:hypothetical protein
LIIIKYLLSALLLSGFSSVDEEGWASVERVEKKEMIEMAGDIDPALWVVFGKQVGSEKVLIAFPEEPTYRYMDGEGKEMEVKASFDGVEYRMQVIDQVFRGAEELIQYRAAALEGAGIMSKTGTEEKNGAAASLVYWKDGYWIFEKMIATADRTYFFQTKSISMEDALHQKFVASFDLERSEK